MTHVSTPLLLNQINSTATGTAPKNILLKTNVFPVALKNVLRSLLFGIACWMMPSIAKADTPIPTQVVSSYDAVLQKLTVTVKWYWNSQASNKHVGAAVFADLNGDGITPTIFSDPSTYNSGGNSFPAGLQARDEFLGQLAVSNIEGSASSARFAGSDNTDNGIASRVPGVTPTTARMLLPYLGNSMAIVNANGNDEGTFTLTYSNVTASPSQICVILYDPHSSFTASGGHSVVSAGPQHNTDNSLEDGNDAGTVSCNTLTTLNCAQNKTEAACQNQDAINASYSAWLATATGSGCNGVLTNNSTGAPSASGGSKTVTFTYTQSGCPNQAAVTTCTATFTVPTCTQTPNLTPIIEYLPSVTHGTKRISIVTTVAETKAVSTNGVITVYVARDPKYSIIWDQNATTAGGKTINNSIWTLDTSNPGFYIFSTTSVIAANGFSRFGFDVIFNPNNSNGQTTITATILQNSGGEATADAIDNTDSDVLVYFLQQ